MAIKDDYSKRIVAGRQRKHIAGTIEFEQHRRAMQRRSPGSKPSILTADAEELVEKYAGKGVVKFKGSLPYPYEEINTGAIIGKTWVKSLGKYVDTKRIRIVYSSKGVHIIPISDYERRVVLWNL
ncbi:hypothetical protein R80B4_01363 [Fibrobacteres bacterium R8-0-B4]